MSRDDAAFEKMLSALPVTTYHAGETILSDGSKTDRLLILKSGSCFAGFGLSRCGCKLLEKDPVALLGVARKLARRLVTTNASLVALKNEVQIGLSPSAARNNVIAKMEQILIPF